MSALGQKQTLRAEVRSGPQRARSADIQAFRLYRTTATNVGSIDHSINAHQNGRRDTETQSFRALEVDHEFKFDRLLHGQVTRLRTLEYLIHVGAAAPAIFRIIRAVGTNRSAVQLTSLL
jgi:hypothetical protein